ncbi:MAG TPA: PilX N-terminal domain-containing pilus assembly protein [Terriglobales bacterium]|jgi:hypothetical protein|nr:PilX N-terminal domain-containing pilus assembly protein [Terriglobales bacterium]
MKNSLCRSKSSSENSAARGIALITTLLLLILLSALATAFVMAVNTENRMQGNDKGNTQAYYGAEAGMEKMMIDLNGLYSNFASPSVAQIQGLSASSSCTGSCPFPSISGMQYTEYSFSTTPSATNPGQPQTWPSTVQAGPNQGLIADVIPISLSVTAKTNSSEEVRMIRNVEVALIPVFQFGVFSQSDLDFFAGPPMEIGGRVQTNGDLYLAAGNGGDTAFLGKLRTAKEVVRDFLANGGAMSSHTGIVEIPTATGGCNQPAKSNCRTLSYTGPDESSWQNGVWPDTVDAFGNTFGGNLNTNPGWGGISSTYAGFLLAHEDGVKPLNLPFVQPGVSDIEILRRAQPADSASLTDSRLYDKAQIRVLLDDDPANLPGGAGDANNIRLANTGTYVNGVPVTKWPAANSSQLTGATACSAACTTFFAEGTNATFLPGPNGDPNWVAAGAPNNSLGDPGGTYTESGTPVTDNGMKPAGAPYMGTVGGFKRWNLIDGWLRVEVRKADGTYLPVTQEWLQLGFARGFAPPTAPGTNTVHPNAILILQQLANRQALRASKLTNPTNGTANSMYPGVVSEITGATFGTPAFNTPTLTATALTDLKKDSGNHWVYATATGSSNLDNPAQVNGMTANNFYPINMYDVREGEPRENTNPNGAAPNRVAGGSYGCTVNGVMNLVEIDVGNLQRWLSGTIGANGTQVENQSQNGYVLYFSDHRGMIPQAPAPKAGTPTLLGSYGFEDVINSGTIRGTPNNGAPDAGEDVEIAGDTGFGLLETYGAGNLGMGFGFKQGDLAPASVIGAGAHRADEVFTRLPLCDIGRANWVSGARHGVRLIDGGPGNLPLRPNSDPNNTGGFTVATDNPAYVLGNYNASAAGYDSTVNYPHASAAVLADTVTLLSNNWNDLNSFASPGSVTGNFNATTNITATRVFGRVAIDTYYRLAIASGKNVDFADPNYAAGAQPIGNNGGATNPADTDLTGTVAAAPSDYGTDGGVHNFLRYLETWGGIGTGNQTIPGASSFYNGSMVSLYYSEYTTGVFKCCGTVYQPPNRNYHFDLDFQNISEVPPGTPRFQEVINVGYKQDLSYR